MVTLTRSGFGGPVSTAADFRGLVPLVLFRALADAGTRVYEPYLDFEAEVPGDTVAAVAAWLAECGAALSGAAPVGAAWLLHGALPARAAPTALHRLAPLTRGEAVCLTRPAGYAPTTGCPRRPRGALPSRGAPAPRTGVAVPRGDPSPRPDRLVRVCA